MQIIAKLAPAAVLLVAACQSPVDEVELTGPTASGAGFVYTAENYDLWPVRTDYYEIQRIQDLRRALAAAGAPCEDGMDIVDRTASVNPGIAWQGDIYRVTYRGRCEAT